MTQLLSPDTFEFFARYLLAGYVVMIVRGWFVIAQRPKATEVVIEAVIFSLVAQLIFQLIAWPVPDTWIDSLGTQFLFFIQVLFLPALLGLGLGWNLARGWNNAVLRLFSMPVTQPVHRAHDYAFHNNREPCLVILTYFDGTQVHGYFGEASLAANDAVRSDIYLERLYDVDANDQWVEFEPSRGALLSLSNMRSIEFLELGAE